MRRPTHQQCFCLILALACLLAALPAAATESLNGTVVDPTGAPVPRATVRLLDPSESEVGHTLTDPQGRFRFDTLPGDTYTLEVELPGFTTARRTVGAGEEVEVKLEVAPVREYVVVTATRTEAPTGQLGSSVTVVGREQLESRHSVTLTELLRTLPGLAIAQSGPPGAFTSVFARGAESDHNKVFVDGVPVNEPGGLFNFANLTPLNLDRVEVVRGPQSALFGSDALGSVVQLFARRGAAETRRPQASVSFEGGKLDTFRGTAGLAGEFSQFDYSIGVEHFLTDNGGPNSAFRNTSVSGNLGLALGRDASLRAVLRGDSGTVGTPGPTAFQRPDSDAFFRRRDRLVSPVFRGRLPGLPESWTHRLSYAYSRSRQRSVNVFLDPPPFSDFPFDFLNDTRRHRASYQGDVALAPTHMLTVAMEYEREKGRIGDFTFPPFVVAHRTNLGTVVQHQAAVFGRLYVAGGVRVEDNGSFGTKVTPRFSVAYFLRLGSSGASGVGMTKLKGNIGTGIKEPQFVESFSPSAFFCGNPALKPERVRSVDVGIEQRLAHDRAKLELNWFDNRFHDLVAFAPGDPNPADALVCFASFFNLGRAKAKGGEAVLEVSPRRGLHLTASYTFLDSQVLRTRAGLEFDPVFGVGRPLLRRPRHAGSLAVVWGWRRLNLTSTLAHVGRRVDTDFLFPPLGLTSNAGYTRWDLAASYRSPHRVTYFVVAENLLNRRYMEVLGFPALKFTVRAGGQLDF